MYKTKLKVNGSFLGLILICNFIPEIVLQNAS